MPFPKYCGAQVFTNRGQASVEWLVVAFVTLSCLMLSTEVSHWFTLRQLLTLHAQRAVELAAMKHGQTAVAYHHLEKNLPATSLQLGMVCVLDDVAAILMDFKDPVMSKKLGQAATRHNYIAAQRQRNEHQGMIQGKGPRSGLTVDQANILNIRVTAFMHFNQPWLRLLMGDFLKLTVDSSAVMQSPRVALAQKCKGSRPRIRP